LQGNRDGLGAVDSHGHVNTLTLILKAHCAFRPVDDKAFCWRYKSDDRVWPVILTLKNSRVWLVQRTLESAIPYQLERCNGHARFSR
jgi:hypothetical protein